MAIWRLEVFGMVITSHMFIAHLECSTKCWLDSRAEQIVGNSYADSMRATNAAYCKNELERFLAAVPESDRVSDPSSHQNLRNTSWRIAVDVQLRAHDVEARLQAIERMPSAGRGKPARFIPYRYESANRLSKHDRLSLGFDAFVLSEVLGRKVGVGKIIHGEHRITPKVATSQLAGEVRKRIKEIIVLVSKADPPDLALNRHCSQCEFQTRCRQEAIEKDDLSLLAGMSETERKKLHGKGIFTVTQLSHTFRPRRRRASRDRPEKFHYSLRALAIRENKIHIVDLPEPGIIGTPVYLDVEGLPDRDFYYLIGIRVGIGDSAAQHSFWADDVDAERRIWKEFLGALSGIPNPQLIHYGSYETVFLNRMRARYGGPPEESPAATAIEHAVNILSYIFARIYFPTYSNGLKEIAHYLGFRWSSSVASGLESIVWRQRWEVSRATKEKQTLLDYNREDCEALELVVNRLVELHHGAYAGVDSSQSDVVHTSDLQREGFFKFKLNEFMLPEMEIINKAAYWDYQRQRVYVKSGQKLTRKCNRHVLPRSPLKANATIEYSRPSSCPTCNSTLIYAHGKLDRTVIDLRFMQHGIKRWITRHVAHRYRCRACRHAFYPPDRGWTASKYGPELAAYTIYQNIEVGVSQLRISSCVEKLFGLPTTRTTVNDFKAAAAQRYLCAYDDLVKRLCSGRLLHVDETRVSVKGRQSYVWVLTSMDEVAYFYTPTREGSTIQMMLKNFSGVLVSDFYSVYDSIDCFQQKCLIHFIRDLNDELLKHPYDDGLKRLAMDFAGLVKPIVETVDRRGLKKRFLGKHRSSVDGFYKSIDRRLGVGEVAEKIIERLQRNRNKMFTFLNFDGVPWNNNNAEHAIKAFALLRRVIGGTTTEKGLRDFLVLLSLCETCKYKNIDFLGFLRSGAKDITDFASQC